MHGSSKWNIVYHFVYRKARAVFELLCICTEIPSEKCGYGCQDMPVLPLPVFNTNKVWGRVMGWTGNGEWGGTKNSKHPKPFKLISSFPELSLS